MLVIVEVVEQIESEFVSLVDKGNLKTISGKLIAVKLKCPSDLGFYSTQMFLLVFGLVVLFGK